LYVVIIHVVSITSPDFPVLMFQRPKSSLYVMLLEMDILLTVLGAAQVNLQAW